MKVFKKGKKESWRDFNKRVISSIRLENESLRLQLETTSATLRELELFCEHQAQQIRELENR